MIERVEGSMAQMESLADGGTHVLGPLPSGGNALFNAESLQLTDRIAYAYILSLSPAVRALPRAGVAGAPLDFDVVQLAKNIAADFRETVSRSSAATGTALMIGAGLAYVAGAPLVAASAATLGAVSFMVHLGVGTAISTILDAGPTAMLNGRAEFEDFRESLEFAGERIVDQLLNSAAGRIGQDLFGPLGGIIGSGARDTVSTLATFSGRIEDAFDSGELPNGPTPPPTATARRTPTGRTPTPTRTPTIMPGSCDEEQVAGADLPDTRTFNLGARSGSFYFQYNTYSQQDRITVSYEGRTLLDTGCVGESRTVTLDYSGSSSTVIVSVLPNCAGGTGTQWDYTVGCQGSAPPTPTPEPFSQMTWGFIDGCGDGQDTLLRLFDTTNNLVWPGSGQAYVVPNNRAEIGVPITCQTGALICFGAEPRNRPGLYWGTGLDNDGRCSTGCCAACADVTIRTQNLICD
jgi:hypothetical protein